VVHIYLLLGNGCFLCCGPTRDYIRRSHQYTSTVALRVVGGDEKGSLKSGRKPQMGALFQDRLAD
jgi:hypothetical protein